MSDLFALSPEQVKTGANAGAWHSVGESGVVGTHAALLHTGQVIFFSRPEDVSHRWNSARTNGLDGDEDRPYDAADTTLATVVDTFGSDAYNPRPVAVEHNPFCSGHTFLSDGRLLVAGGDKKARPDYNQTPEGTKYGLNSLRVLVPDGAGSVRWTPVGTIADSRWYPTCTLLGDGSVFIVSGSIDDQQSFNNQNPTCELLPPAAGGAQFLHCLVEAWPYHSYPFVFVLPSGALFLFVKDSGYYLTARNGTAANRRWNVEQGPRLQGEPAKHYPNNAAAVLLPLLPSRGYAAEVLLIGGGGQNIYSQFADTTIPGVGQQTYEVPASRDCFRCRVEPSEAGAQWERVQPMHFRRVMPDAVLLPDGTVLVVNGGCKGFAGGNAATGPCVPKSINSSAPEEYAVLTAELYEPTTGQWRTLAAAGRPRLYHSTALLLPDARVLVAGSDHQVNEREWRREALSDSDKNKRTADTYEYALEVFTPPYLLGEGIRRPKIEVPPAQRSVRYGVRFEVSVANLGELADEGLTAALVRPGSVTHNNNMSQRYVGLDIVSRSSTHLTLQSPPDGNVAPPGYYMLFLLDRGVPSEAQFVRLCQDHSRKAADAQLPTSELAVWLRADAGVETDSNDLVSFWGDLSGCGNDVRWHMNTEAGAIQRMPRLLPSELNGHPVIRFNVASNWQEVWGGYLESANSAFLPGSGPYAVFVVAHAWPSGPTGKGGVLGWGNFDAPSGSNAAVGLSLAAGPRSPFPPDDPPYWYNAIPARPGMTGLATGWDRESHIGTGDDTPVPMSQAVLLETVFDGSQCQLKLNGRELNSEPMQGKNTGDGPLTVGRSGRMIRDDATGEIITGDFFRGDIAEVLIYNRAVTEHEALLIQDYLRRRYELW